ncbi:hypothetical protein ABZT06_49310 [Streptomyces sp. NPDC005483]|uniref:hypothetical protein n=1 Tax=Streptomyces sp. NPDC005483 TaxID=3154882 RepID=UPI0033BCBF52
MTKDIEAPPRTPRRPPLAPITEVPASPAAAPQFRIADYLEKHGRTIRRHLCPPASFWHAAHTHLVNPDDLGNLTEAAAQRHRLQWAHHLRHRAAEHGDINALYELAMMREEAGDRAGAQALARQAADHGHGHTDALHRLAMMREEAGNRAGVEALLRQAADHGNARALYPLARMTEMLRRLWPYGLDPDGTPTPPWQPPWAPTLLG